eukprot:scaffold10099_cov23-Cyclotella_meneghiniana.AAC.1
MMPLQILNQPQQSANQCDGNNEEDMFRKSENVQESRWNLNYLAPPGSWLVTMVCHLEMKTTMKSFMISSSGGTCSSTDKDILVHSCQF